MSNRITNDLKTCNNYGLRLKSVYLFVYDSSLIFNVFIYIHEYENIDYLNMYNLIKSLVS